MKKWLIFLSVLLVSLAIYFRFFQLGKVPVSLYWDEIAILVDARSVAETGLDMHGNSMWQTIFPSYGDYKLPVYIWLASLSVKLFGANEWAVRLPSALAGLGTVLMAFVLAHEFFPMSFKKEKDHSFFHQHLFLPVLSAGIIAIAPWSVLFSRTAFEGHLAQFLVTLSIWFALKQKKYWGWGLMAAVLGSIATYTYFSVRYVWPVVFVLTTILFVWQYKKNWWRQALLLIVLPLITYFWSLQPMYESPLYEVSTQFRLSTTSVLNMADWPVVSNEYKLQAGNTYLDKIIYHPKLLLARELVKNYADNMSLDFLFFTGDSNLRHGTGNHGLFLWIFLPGFFYGWYRLFPKHWKQGLLFLVWWLVALLPASVPESTPHALRSLNALMPLTLVIGWGSYRLLLDAEKLKSCKFIFLKKICPVLFLGIIFLSFLVVFDFNEYLFKVYPKTSATSWQAGYKELAHVLWQEKDGKDTIWIESFDGRFHLWLMGYEMPVNEFAQLKYENYVPDKLGGNIVIKPFDWDKGLTMEPKTIVAGTKNEVDAHLKLFPIKPTWYKIITIEDSSTPFAVVYFEK